MLVRKLRSALQQVRFRALAVARGPCAACGFPALIRLNDSEMGVRCPRCGASAVTLSIVEVIRTQRPDLRSAHVYELSATGPLVAFLAAHCPNLTTSEFLDGIEPGTCRDGIRCEDVQRLTFADASFDLCTSTEVFEHVADDRAGFAELFRVLKPGGQLVFTVPLHDAAATVERARIEHGKWVHLHPPEYHADRRNGPTILVCRDYGRDIVDRILDAGFVDARIIKPRHELFGHARPVLVARKPT